VRKQRGNSLRPQRGSKEEGSDYAEPSLEGPGRVDLPETALSLTSSRCISGSLPKRRSQISGLGWILRVQVFGPRRGLFVAMVTGGRDRPTVACYTDARERGDSINP